ncbi:type II toxin-antitoxin system prevent-host-death family antitoxin [Mesorhizobium sp. YIM 152430]|jgi:prevent-host-death family protein|nr:type II toxin-antitoxin system prevent-host-death family antitoxin [Mesorhizobium sp. YIM 152430]
MKTVSATELKANVSGILGDVERGETIAITRHGKTIARLEPPTSRLDRERAIEAILEMKRLSRKTGLTVDDILSARDEGRR